MVFLEVDRRQVVVDRFFAAVERFLSELKVNLPAEHFVGLVLHHANLAMRQEFSERTIMRRTELLLEDLRQEVC
jgi:hypothetical protein